MLAVQLASVSARSACSSTTLVSSGIRSWMYAAIPSPIACDADTRSENASRAAARSSPSRVRLTCVSGTTTGQSYSRDLGRCQTFRDRAVRLAVEDEAHVTAGDLDATSV